MYDLVRPLLFRLDAERAHNLTLALLHAAGQIPVANYFLRTLFDFHDPRLYVDAFGIQFKNPIGLAAGYDKNGVALPGLTGLGFGHIEIGTVTRAAQVGNPRPRIHRVTESGALINSMGFPNAGVDSVGGDHSSLASGVRAGLRPVRVGINIGKSKDTPLESAAEDYVELLRRVHARADYIAINISSPNTTGLRNLQSRAEINALLRAVKQVRDALTPRVPLLVKISPDLSEPEIDNVLDAIMYCDVDGIIATNTTLDHAAIRSMNVAGGLSGVPLRSRSTQVIRYIARQTSGKLPIIGVGGVFSAADALEKLRAGARLVQIYTGLVYRGPGLVREINRELVRRCERAGLKNIAEMF